MADFTMWLVWPETPDNAPEAGPVLLNASTAQDALSEARVLNELCITARPIGYRVYDDLTGNLLGEWDTRH